MSEREIVFWSCQKDAETLSYEEKDEAIEAFLDQQMEPGCAVLAVLPAEIEVFGYARMIPSGREPDPEMLLEQVLESLDEEYGDPDGYGPSEISPAMEAAAKAFCDVVRAEYVSWNCEPITSEKMPVEAWVREHRPDWLSATEVK